MAGGVSTGNIAADLDLSLGIGPSTVSTSLKSGATTGGITFGSKSTGPLAAPAPWSAWMPAIAAVAVVAVGAFILSRMRRA